MQSIQVSRSLRQESSGQQHLIKQHGSSSTRISAKYLLEHSRQVPWDAWHPSARLSTSTARSGLGYWSKESLSPEPTKRVDARQRSGRWELKFDTWRRLGKQHHNRGSTKLTFDVTRPGRGSSLWGGQKLPGKAEKEEKDNARPSSKTLTGSQRSYLRQHGVADRQFLKENWRHIWSVCTLIHSGRGRWSPCQDWRDQHTQAFSSTLPNHGWKKSQRSWGSPEQVPHQDPTESRTRCIE